VLGFFAFSCSCTCVHSSFQQQVSAAPNLIKAQVYSCWEGQSGGISGVISGRNNVTYCAFRVDEVYKGNELRVGVTYITALIGLHSIHTNTEYLLEPHKDHGSVWKITMCGLNMPFSRLNIWQLYVIKTLDTTTPNPCTLLPECHNCTYKEVQCIRYPCAPVAECGDNTRDCSSLSHTDCTADEDCSPIFATSCSTDKSEFVGCQSSHIMCGQIVTCGTSPRGETYTFPNLCVPKGFTTHPSNGNCCSE